jgi:hypothetical protein
MRDQSTFLLDIAQSHSTCFCLFAFAPLAGRVYFRFHHSYLFSFFLLICYEHTYHIICINFVAAVYHSGYIYSPLSPYSEELDICIYGEHFVFN